MERTPSHAATAQPLADGIITAAREGDARAIETAITQCYPPVKRFLRYLADDPNVADDLTQNVMLRAARHLSALSSDASLMPWLYQMARNALHSYGRRRGRRPMDSLEQWMEYAFGNQDIIEPVSAIEQIEDDVCVEQLLDPLSPADRELIYLRYVAGFTATEIGTILRIAPAAVRQRIHRAVGTTRQHAEANSGDTRTSHAQQEATDGAL